MAVRVTQRHTCSQCNGNGEISFPGDGCGNCKGKGYLETLPGDEAVCPGCKGEGYRMASRVCKECKGKGFQVSIYEVTDYSVPCAPCSGTGRTGDQRQLECLVCHGKGVITDKRIRRIK